MSRVALLEAQARDLGIDLHVIYEYPPIPVRCMDFAAIDRNTYEANWDDDGLISHNPIGRGATREEAIADLLELIAAGE